MTVRELAVDKWKRFGRAGWMPLIVVVVLGAVGADEEQYLLVQIANGMCAVTSAVMALWAFTTARPVWQAAAWAGVALAAAYLTYDIWPSVPVYEVLAVILDEG